MRTKIFFLAMLVSVAASATVKVTPITTDYSAQKVTFKVEWTNTPTAPYNNRVWVWIDFCPVTGTTPGGFSPATITGSTITSGSGSISGLTGRGFFITGSTTNTGTTVTAALNPVPAGKFNWCVYGSDYPPNVTLDKGTYTFKGTTNFIVNNPAQTVTTKTIAKTNLTVNSSTTFTDATGCPGIGSLYCPYTGSDLYMDATHLCQLRTSGAKNWEAYIKDSDGQIYRITQFSNNRWWFADDYNINEKVNATCGGKRYYAYNNYPACPAGWSVPTIAEINARWVNLPNNDAYGGAISVGYFVQQKTCYVDRGGRFDTIAKDCTPGAYGMGVDGWRACNDLHHAGRMRCLRQL